MACCWPLTHLLKKTSAAYLPLLLAKGSKEGLLSKSHHQLSVHCATPSGRPHHAPGDLVSPLRLSSSEANDGRGSTFRSGFQYDFNSLFNIMTDSSSASSPDMPHRLHPPSRPRAEVKSITGTASAGFRLSLALNAVGTESALRHEMASADVEIQVIAKKISEFSLMLKQVGKIVEENRTIASPSAIDTVAEIKDQSERDFDEIKSMIEMVQKRDETGNFRGIEVANRVTWAFKKRKMQYLLGQLEYLKDSLAIMLQTLQLAKEIAAA